MIIFIDESGDLGFKFKKSSSRFFIINAVFFEDDLVAEEVNLAIKKLRRRLKIPDGFEFKFSKTKKSFRTEFLRSIRLFKFYYLSIAVDKQSVDCSLYKKSKMRFYDFVISKFVQGNKRHFQKSVIYFDKMLDSLMIKSFNTYLRKMVKITKSKNKITIKHVRSQSNNLIQLADMIAGTLFHKFEYGKLKYYNLIKVREKLLMK